MLLKNQEKVKAKEQEIFDALSQIVESKNTFFSDENGILTSLPQFREVA